MPERDEMREYVRRPDQRRYRLLQEYEDVDGERIVEFMDPNGHVDEWPKENFDRVFMPVSAAPPSRDDLGRAAYEAGAEHREAESLDDYDDLPGWAGLEDSDRELWCCIGEAVAAQCGAIPPQSAATPTAETIAETLRNLGLNVRASAN